MPARLTARKSSKSGGGRTSLRVRLAQAVKGPQVYPHLFDAILEQRLSPGARLSEQQLAEAFGVSRTLIRQALIRLHQEGVITIEKYRGAQVASHSPSDAKEVLWARQVVECALVRKAAERITAQDEKESRQAAAEEEAAFARGNRGTGLRLSGEFHLLIALIAGNQRLFQFLRSLVSQTSLIISQYERPSTTQCAFDEHCQLIANIASGDVDRAEMSMRVHLQALEDRLQLDSVGETPKDLHEIFAEFRFRR